MKDKDDCLPLLIFYTIVCDILLLFSILYYFVLIINRDKSYEGYKGLYTIYYELSKKWNKISWMLCGRHFFLIWLKIKMYCTLF